MHAALIASNQPVVRGWGNLVLRWTNFCIVIVLKIGAERSSIGRHAMTTQTNPNLLEQALAAKDAFRNRARAATWPQKITTIERLRDTIRIARLAMNERSKTLGSASSLNGTQGRRAE